ncbi:MAG: amidophosphoribosyltransferase [Deltaproteobacteria bacterium]|nr:MAG: amidophosphoribosyltransferase [Deltaproteobacteria bacterium]
MRATLQKARGAYSIVAALMLDGKETLVAVRDPWGIRPAVWGRLDGAFIVASESVALDAIDAFVEGDIAPGEMVVFQKGREPLRFDLGAQRPAPCIFEYIYFARPDSIINGHSVYGVRLALGRQLAEAWKKKGLEADVVIPIPDTSRPSAGALAEELGLPYREGFIKNRYTGRTFIMPTHGLRASTLKLKLNPIRSEFSGRRVLVVDDSIVRGSTLRRTIQLIREQGASQVHLVIHSPPVLFPCYYGIDMSTEDELVARAFCDRALLESGSPELERAREQVEGRLAAHLGLDSLTYLPLESMNTAFESSRCAACFDGDYPLRLSDEERQWLQADRRTCVQRSFCL